ncbi:glutathione S-transferase [Enhydrobacter aerosaccus]|uniref:Glutathione S-transferase n=1 Tax=Enhydrobacter aerosaccus TaxID=225324 RepID=A0A1T4LUR4_9HYPH|nr:glutathione S-transferase family protein [Enhydrobacter aerosaccus]SJZ58238.1 glutathione S-transferase [Enhydrobacter aerosaccus]
MTPVLFVGHPLGSSTGLLAAFEWAGEPYRVVRVKMPDEMLTDGYRRLNARRETPVLIRETGEVLTQTLAIASWLEQRDRARRIGFEPGTARWYRAHELMAFINTNFTAAFASLWVALEVTTLTERQREVLRDYGLASVARRHQQLEEMMGDSPFLGGDAPMLPDAILAGVARWGEFHGAVAPDAYPKLRAWKERMANDRGFQTAVALEEGRPDHGSQSLKAMIPLDDVLRSLG